MSDFDDIFQSVPTLAKAFVRGNYGVELDETRSLALFGFTVFSALLDTISADFCLASEDAVEDAVSVAVSRSVVAIGGHLPLVPARRPSPADSHDGGQE